MYITQHFNKGCNSRCSWIFCSLTGFYNKFWVKSRENRVLPWSDRYCFLFPVCAGPTVNNSVTSRVKRYHHRYHEIIGGSKVIAREFPHMVSCRSHLTYFTSLVAVSSYLFILSFLLPYFRPLFHYFFLSFFLSFLLTYFLSFFLRRSTLTSPYRRCCTAGSTDSLLPTSPPAPRLLTFGLLSNITIAYFRPPLPLHDCLLPTSPQASQLLTSDLSSSPTVA